MHAASIACDDLWAIARVRLADTFALYSHRPSTAHWLALEDILKTLKDMGDSICQPKIFVSSRDPGSGKSQCLAQFRRALVRSRNYSRVGALICFRRVEEAKDKLRRRCSADLLRKSTRTLSLSVAKMKLIMSAPLKGLPSHSCLADDRAAEAAFLR